MAELNENEKPPKKQRTDIVKDEFDKTNPFIKGSQFDEIELKFDTEESIFVSKSFLSYASRVFERMFRSDFKESQSQCVGLTGKKYDAFLDMLLYLHPRIQKPISADKAKDIYMLAHEYEIPTVLGVCDEILHKIVEEVFIETNEPYLRPIVADSSSLDLAFQWLHFAETYGNRKLLNRAAERISVLPFETLKDMPSYRKLSLNNKYKILMYRLTRFDQRKVVRAKLPM